MLGGAVVWSLHISQIIYLHFCTHYSTRFLPVLWVWKLVVNNKWRTHAEIAAERNIWEQKSLFGPTVEEIRRRWEKVLNKSLYELHPSPDIIKISVRGGHAGHDM
jgi:hypothetical protein